MQSPSSSDRSPFAKISRRFSALGTGRARGPTIASRSLAWPQAGFIVFAFAAPSACISVAYALAMAGAVGGSLICAVVTCASVGGSMMLLQVKLAFPSCHTLGDLGFQVLGNAGKIWGNIIQLGNFLLFLPVALLFCAQALEGIVQIPGFEGCNDYYIFVIAAICLLTTQLRTLKNTQVLSTLSVLSVFGMAVLQIIAAFTYEVEDKVPVQAFGNPNIHWSTSIAEALLGTTTAAWAFVPAFLTVELATCMEAPQKFNWSLVLAGVLNMIMFIGVGLTVVLRWGYTVGETITLTNVGAWNQGTWLNTSLSVCLLIGNFVSYMLDSVPLARYCQRVWAPDFQDTWSIGDILCYLGYTLPTFLFGFVLSVLVPNLFVLLAFTTALTIPWVTQIYPAVLYWKAFKDTGSEGLLRVGNETSQGMSRWKMLGVAAVFLIGCVNFVVCFVAAVAKVSIAELRGPSQIGCGSWLVWSG